MASKTLIVQYIKTNLCSVGKFLISFYYIPTFRYVSEYIVVRYRLSHVVRYGTVRTIGTSARADAREHFLVPGEDFVGFIESCIEFLFPGKTVPGQIIVPGEYLGNSRRIPQEYATKVTVTMKVAVVTTQSLPCPRGHEESELLAIKKRKKIRLWFYERTTLHHFPNTSCVRILISF